MDGFISYAHIHFVVTPGYLIKLVLLQFILSSIKIKHLLILRKLGFCVGLLITYVFLEILKTLKNMITK